MALQQFTNLNFEDIKTSIKDYLRQNSNFTDMDFEGSNLSVIVNLLAYNSYTTAYNTNAVVNETFIDSATLRENVVSLARNIGYVPRSKRASRMLVDYGITGITTTTKTITFEPGFIGNGSVSNINFLFSIPEKVTGTASDGIASGTIEVFQGQYLQSNFTVNNSLPNQRYILPNNGVDTSTIRVKVRENNSSDTLEEYKLVDNIIGITSTSNIYLIQETTDEKYEVLFGDGIFGKELSNGNVIEISYIKTEGKEGNGVSRLSFSGTITNENNATETEINGDLVPQFPSQNGDDIEDIKSVRYYAPRLYSSQHRAVTANDYEAIVPSVYPNIESISAFGGEELTPPKYGRVFIAAKPKNGAFLSNFTKKQILTSLKNYSVAGIVPEIIDLKFLYVELDTHVYYNANFVGDTQNLRTDIINAMSSFAGGTELNKFGGRFKYSKVLSLIDRVSDSITSNITTIRIRRNLVAQLNVFSQYEICFDNTFHRNESNYNIKSTGFTVSGVSGTVYFSDQHVSGDKGNLFLFQIDGDSTVKILSNTFGSVDYKKGEVIIDTVNITSTLLSDNIIEIQAVPQSNDVLARKELYLQFDVSNSNFFMREDPISTGANTSGTRYDPQSSYSNGAKVRGAIITSSASSSNLVGYVNGNPYYGPFHFHPDTGKKMVGEFHVSTPHDTIYSTKAESLGIAADSAPIDSSSSSTMTSTSSSSSSSSSSSGYGY
tara:strand:- start:7193 stop:9346 length:2154 start_codon:yes stop_codon:yes gene_type:complete